MTKVLVGEDDQMLSSLMVRRLQAEGYDTDASYDGDETIKKVGEWKPDVLLLDILMPGKTGYDVLDALSKTTVRANLRVVILSNLSAPEDMERAKTYGVFDFLVKANTTPAEVADKVKSLILPNAK
ncbi:response regulator [Candidatus Parcubacteria bacterium]|nr:MAG: response regulator [Candidatus Parcubacteria bacterium]